MPTYRTRRQELERRLKALLLLLVIGAVVWFFPGGKKGGGERGKGIELVLDEDRLDVDGGRAKATKEAVEEQLARSAMGSSATMNAEHFLLEMAPEQLWVKEAFSDVYAEGEVWRRAEEMYTIFDALIRSSYPSSLSSIRQRCSALSQQQQLADPECHAEWAHRLKTAEIADVDMMLGFDKGKRNALRVVFVDGSYGWFKTCPGDGEHPDMEISAYHLDHILGFHLVSPAVRRDLLVKEVEAVIKAEHEDFKEILAQTDYLCSERGTMHGVMLGWWDDVVPVRSPIPKKDADAEEVLAYRRIWNKRIIGLPLSAEEIELNIEGHGEETSGELATVGEGEEDTMQKHRAKKHTLDENYPFLQMPRVHSMMFLYLVLQHQGHNEFRIDNGPLVIIDVDRALFSSTKRFEYYNLGLQSLCKMDTATYDAFTYFKGSQTPGRNLGALLGKVLLRYNPHVVVDSFVMDTINTRVDMLSRMMDKCILLHGEADVLYELDWEALRVFGKEDMVVRTEDGKELHAITLS